MDMWLGRKSLGGIVRINAMPMKYLIITSLVFYCALRCDAQVSLIKAGKHVEYTLHPLWSLKEANFSKKYTSLTLLRSSLSATATQWGIWQQNVKNHPHHFKVKNVLLSHCYISEKEMAYLCNFENIETLRLGNSIEGVLLSAKALSHISKLKKLKHLHLSIHGISDAHFEAISKNKSISSIVLEFPSVAMVHKDELKYWSKTNLSDAALAELAKMKSLEALNMNYSPAKGHGKVKFTFESLKELLKLSSLSDLRIDPSVFSEK